ncbi:hypothetical protein [Halolamina pelagica]|nr:hypothetical protein [Halolamina pelagica]
MVSERRGPAPPAERARLLATAPFSQYEAAFARTVGVVDDLVSHEGDG